MYELLSVRCLEDLRPSWGTASDTAVGSGSLLHGVLGGGLSAFCHTRTGLQCLQRSCHVGTTEETQTSGWEVSCSGPHSSKWLIRDMNLGHRDKRTCPRSSEWRLGWQKVKARPPDLDPTSKDQPVACKDPQAHQLRLHPPPTPRPRQCHLQNWGEGRARIFLW